MHVLNYGDSGMQKNVSVRFFKILKHNAGDQGVQDTLNIILSKISTGENVERETSNDAFVQMDRLSKVDGIWVGEISRNQKTNFPHEVTDNGPIPLSTDNNLGHGIAFSYDPANSCLALQFDTQIVSPSRFIAYLNDFGAKGIWHDAVLRKGIIGKLDDFKAKKIVVGIASPTSFSGLGDETIESTANELGRAYGGANLQIIISAERGGFLNEGVLPMVGSLLGNEHLRALKIKTDRPSGHEDHELNLIKEVMRVDRELNLDDRDPDVRYGRCSSFVQESYSAQKAYITANYG